VAVAQDETTGGPGRHGRWGTRTVATWLRAGDADRTNRGSGAGTAARLAQSA